MDSAHPRSVDRSEGGRIRCSIGLALVILAVGPNTGSAQQTGFPYSIGRQDLLIASSGLGLSVLGNHLRRSVGPISLPEIQSLRVSDVNGFDQPAVRVRSSVWSDRSDEYLDWVMRTGLLVGACEAFTQEWSDTATLGVMLAETASWVYGMTYLSKAIVKRRRPYVYNTSESADERFLSAQSDGGDVYFSFFSGHASSSFALATFTSRVFTDIHGRSVWSDLLWGSSLSLAVLTSVSRVKAGVHFPTDVIAGALAGAAIGYLVPELHKKGRDERVQVGMGPDRLLIRIQVGTTAR